MSISDLLLPEFDNEIVVTRRVLERVPDDRGHWKPHDKSFPMAHLAQLVARLPAWVNMIIAKTELDIRPKDGPAFPGYSYETTATLLAEFDRNVAAARPVLAACSDEDFHVAWTLKAAGEPMMTTTRYGVLRSMVLNHLVHHRAQLALYLRMVDLPVPSMYGPSGDEKVG
ncbi:MAG TPA: DinB family protein [Gemmatimonadaceae bacterium]|jgi:hypothetical protein